MTIDTKKYQRLLCDLKYELETVQASGEAAAQTVELDQTRMGRLSRMDAMQQQEMSKATNQRRQLKLLQIEAALLRIENNDYGFCTECEELINPKRLELDPSSLLCIQCASDKET